MVSQRIFGLVSTLFLFHRIRADLHVDDFDPLTDYCRRFMQQTAVIDRRLYIDGGFVNYGDSVQPTTTNYTNTHLLYLDLDSLQSGYPVEYANLSKPPDVPSVTGGALWADTVNNVFYLYGGEYNWTSRPPEHPTLWSYDVKDDLWTSKPGSADISPSSFGASVVVDNTAVAYYYGGWTSNATSLGASGYPAAQNGLISYNMVHDTWRNVSFFDSTARAEGVMLFIPAGGMLRPVRERK